MLIGKVLLGLLVIGAGAAAVATSGGAGALTPQQTPPPAQAVVAAFGDAGSFDVRADGRTIRVRLADVAAPAAPAPDRPGQCLGAEAATFLASMVPVGTLLTLSYGTDRFGRNLAAATAPDGRLLNAELARAGFAGVSSVGLEPAATGGAAGVRPAVEAAVRDAAAGRRGLHSPAVACTVPGRVKAVLDAAARVPAGPAPGARGADLHVAAASAAAARAAADELIWAFQQNREEVTWRVLDQGARSDLQRQVTEARDRVAAAEVALRGTASATFNQEATALSVRTEELRVAKAQAAARAAEMRRLAQLARRAEAARQARAAAVRAARQRAESEREPRGESSRNSNRPDSGRRDSNGSRNDSESRDR